MKVVNQSTMVTVAYSNGASYSFQPFGAFAGGASVAIGDVTGDGVPDIVVASGVSGTTMPGTVDVFNGANRSLIASYTPLGGFGGGLNVALGDVTGAGYSDIIVGVEERGWPAVLVLDGKNGKVLDEFLAYSTSYLNGVQVSAGHLSPTGPADVIVAPSSNANSLPVQVFSGATIAAGSASPTVLKSFFPETSTYTGGESIAVGDLVAGEPADLIVGTSTTGERLQTYSGASLLSSAPPKPLFSQNAWSFVDNSGVKIALVSDPQNNGLDDLLVTDGTSAHSERLANAGLTSTGWNLGASLT